MRNLYWPQPDKAQPWWRRKLWHLFDIYNLAMRRQLNIVLDREKPDIVLLHNLVGWSIAVVDVIAARKIPMIQVLHDHYNICPNSMMFKNGRNCVKQCAGCSLMRAPHRIITNKISAVVGVSQYILDRHLADGAYTKVPVKRVIHNVRSANTLGLAQAPALRAKAMAERGDVSIRFGFIGYIADFKGIEFLLREFATLNLKNAELWVAGSGKPEYVAMLRQKYQHQGIKFLGHVKPKEFFTAIDVAIVPSLWQENFPGVVSESFAFGVPVIGSRRGGIPEMGLEEGAGIAFDLDKPGELAAAMRFCAEDAEAVSRMGQVASQKSATFLDTDNWALKYESVYCAIS